MTPHIWDSSELDRRHRSAFFLKKRHCSLDVFLVQFSDEVRALNKTFKRTSTPQNHAALTSARLRFLDTFFSSSHLEEEEFDGEFENLVDDQMRYIGFLEFKDSNAKCDILVF